MLMGGAVLEIAVDDFLSIDRQLVAFLEKTKSGEERPRANAAQMVVTFLKESTPQKIRRIDQWAEQELFIPAGGPAGGRRFKLLRQPYVKLWLEELARSAFMRYVAVGPTQSGKTYSAFALPIMYTLFELRINVICGVPNKDFIKDKWEDELRPAIEASRYKKYLPKKGAGSQGGVSMQFNFGNGVWLRFMPGGGSAKARAGKTSSRLFTTESDGFNPNGITGNEGDKISQLEGRVQAHNINARIVHECTASIPAGYIWMQYTAGTESRICCPCPHCGDYVTPEREHLVGWQEAENEVEAEEAAHFICPSCASAISEDERRIMNEQAVLAHKGQTVDPNGEVHGDAPKVKTFGFRWSAFNNLFQSMGYLGICEWNCKHAEDQENANTVERQQRWALPAEPSAKELEVLTLAGVTGRQGTWGERIAPADTQKITVGIDIGKWQIYFCVIAWRESGGRSVIEYGVLDVPSESMEECAAIENTLYILNDKLNDGWERDGGGELHYDFGLVDAGYQTDTIYKFTQQHDRLHPMMGFGDNEYKRGSYSQPKAYSATVRHIGTGWHSKKIRKQIDGNRFTIQLYEVSANHWKSVVHHSLAMPAYEPGAITIYKVDKNIKHNNFVRQITAETQVQEFVSGRGFITKWVQAKHRPNHWGDTMYLATAAGDMVGATQLAQAYIESDAGSGEDSPAKKQDKVKSASENKWTQSKKSGWSDVKKTEDGWTEYN